MEVAVGVELFNVAKLQPGLLQHPATQTTLQRAVIEGVERTVWQGVLTIVGDGQQPRGFTGHRDNCCIEPDNHRKRAGHVGPTLTKSDSLPF